MSLSFGQHWHSFKKLLVFGLWGAGGCLLGALVGEVLLAVTRVPPPPPPSPSPPRAVCLLIDCSGSMGGGKLDEVKSAARAFVENQTPSRSMISVVGFGSRTKIACGLTGDLPAARRAIAGLGDGGGTEMASALNEARGTLAATSWERSILLFTDGMPSSQPNALRAAEECRRSGIRLVAIGTGDAKTDYLGELTGDDALVFEAASGEFGKAFRRAGRAIYGQLLATNSVDEGFGVSLLKVAAWSSLLAMCLALALVIGQNRYARRRLLGFRDGLFGGGGGLVAGAVAGAVGQSLFGTAGGISAVEIAARILAWAILGSIFGIGMSFFVPNIKRKRAAIGGAVGGMLGGIAFLWVAESVSDWAGRLLGAAILGFFIGLMMALVEVLAREAWLIVHWGEKERSTINLGDRPVLVGSSRKADIYLPENEGIPPEAATLTFVNGRIVFEDRMKGQEHILNDGNKLVVGHITIEVHAR